MRFEWDEAKRRRNLENHGIDFIRAQEVFDGRPALTHPSGEGVGLLEKRVGMHPA